MCPVIVAILQTIRTAPTPRWTFKKHFGETIRKKNDKIKTIPKKKQMRNTEENTVFSKSFEQTIEQETDRQNSSMDQKQPHQQWNIKHYETM